MEDIRSQLLEVAALCTGWAEEGRVCLPHPTPLSAPASSIGGGAVGGYCLLGGGKNSAS